MRFGREMHDPLDAMLAKERRHQRLVADGTLHENVPRIGGELAQVVAIARIGQRVEIDHELDGFCMIRGQQVMDKIGADEPGPARDENFHDDVSQIQRCRESASASRTGRRGSPSCTALVVSSTQLERRATAMVFMNSSSESK